MSGSLLTAREAADAIGCTIPQLRRLAEGGKIPFVKVNRNILLFAPEQVEAYRVSLVHAEALSVNGPWIYFVQMKYAQHVKIGKANDVVDRITTLRCGNPEPLQVLVTVQGDRLREHRIHALLDHYRMEGEWFRWEGPIPELVDRLKAGHAWREVLAWLDDTMEGVLRLATLEAIAAQ